jgi:hypothetical protein
MSFNSITRTEVFYTANLHFASINNTELLRQLLQTKLPISDQTKITSSNFELCLFRDLAKAELIDRVNDADIKKLKHIKSRKAIEKITFDNAFLLSDSTLILIEAKVQQGFSKPQLNVMLEAAKILEHTGLYRKVYCVGLHSSKYSPRSLYGLDAMITWREIIEYIGDPDQIFARADLLYRN